MRKSLPQSFKCQRQHFWSCVCWCSILRYWYFRSHLLRKRFCCSDVWHSLEGGWVQLSARRKSSLLRKWKGPGSLSLMVWHHHWEHKAAPWIPMGKLQSPWRCTTSSRQTLPISRGLPTHQPCVHVWLTEHIHSIGLGQTQNLPPGTWVSSHFLICVN